MSFSIDQILNSLKDEHFMENTALGKTTISKDPCAICLKPILAHHGSIECDTCELWVHNKCNGTTPAEYEAYQSMGELFSWECLKCRTKRLCDNIAYMFLNNVDIDNLNSMKYFHSLLTMK